MTITVELADDIATHEDAGREAVEAVAIAGYRSGVLSPYQTRLLLGFETRDQLDGFLKKHDVWEYSYDMESYREDMESLVRLEERGLVK